MLKRFGGEDNLRTFITNLSESLKNDEQIKIELTPEQFEEAFQVGLRILTCSGGLSEAKDQELF
jgi:hypothetical protein